MKKILLALSVLVLCGCTNATPSENVEQLIIHETDKTKAFEHDLNNFNDNDVSNYFYLITTEELPELEDYILYEDFKIGYYESDDLRENIIEAYGETSEVAEYASNYENNAYSIVVQSKGVIDNETAIDMFENVFDTLNGDNSCFARNRYHIWANE